MKVLLIAPACDGEDVGEAWLAFQWAKLLSDRVELTLLTTYKRGHTPASRQLPGVRVIEWAEPPGVGRFERLNSLLQPGYVGFYYRARRWIKRQLSSGEHFTVAHQVVPVAMRYPSPAVGLGVPLVIGPVGGSLESPDAFVSEESATPWWQRLRSLDGWRLVNDPWLRKTFESAACVIGIAPYVRDRLSSALKIPRFEVMSDVAVHSVPDRVERSPESRPVRLLFVGRIIRTKGVRDLIRSLALVRDLDVSLDVVGDGNDRQACQELSVQLRLSEKVTFHGKLPRDEVDAYYRQSDVFVFPSYREPGGSVVVEAMSFGLPLVVCSNGGPGANVNDECAIRLEASSPAQLAHDCAEAIRELAENADRRAAMGRAARIHAEKAHLWSGRLDRMLAIYADASRS